MASQSTTGTPETGTLKTGDAINVKKTVIVDGNKYNVEGQLEPIDQEKEEEVSSETGEAQVYPEIKQEEGVSQGVSEEVLVQPREGSAQVVPEEGVSQGESEGTQPRAGTPSPFEGVRGGRKTRKSKKVKKRNSSKKASKNPRKKSRKNLRKRSRRV